MSGIGLPELLIIAAIAVLLFGAGRVGRLGSELGTGIRAFKEALVPVEHDDRSD